MGWLQAQVRQSKLLEVLLCALVVAAVVGFGVYKFKYLQNVQLGPYDIPVAELVAAKSTEDLPRYWVRVTPSAILDTGVDHITVRRRRGVETGRSVSGHFWLAQVGNRILFLEAHGTRPEQGQVLTGYLVDPRADTMDHLTKGLSAQGKAALHPLMLDLGTFDSEATGGLAIGVVLVLGAFVWAAFALRRALRPDGHPRLRALEAASIPLDEAGQSIAHDIRAGESVPVGAYRLTRDYLVKTGLGFDLRPLKDLLWTYPIVVSHKMFYVIPTGKSHQLALYFPDKQLTLKIPNPAVERVLGLLGARAPWALFGHSAEIEAAWKKQRAKLVAFVAERRAQVLAQSAAPAQAGAPPQGGPA